MARSNTSKTDKERTSIVVESHTLYQARLLCEEDGISLSAVVNSLLEWYNAKRLKEKKVG